MARELSKAYEPKQVEAKWYPEWEEQGFFHAEVDPGRPAYCITIPPLAVGLLFRALLNADFGLIGYWARVAGISGPHGFLGDPASALGALVLIDAWEWTPLMALILLAGLKTLPLELIEAAEVDGATYLQRLRLVALPMMLPSIFLALVLRSMDA